MKISRLEVRQEFFPIVNVRVIDGDCIEATILLAFGACVIKRIRLKGFWAPEMEGRLAARGVRATQKLTDWVLGRDLFIRCPGCRLDRYGRVLAELWHATGPANPHSILGEDQLTMEQHKQELDLVRKAAGTFIPPAILDAISELKPLEDEAA